MKTTLVLRSQCGTIGSRIAILTVGACFLAIQLSHAQVLRPGGSVDEITATQTRESGDIRIANVQDAVGFIEKAYGIPICYESRQTLNEALYRNGPKTRGFAVDSDEALSSSLTRYCNMTNDAYRWANIKGSVCVYPAIPDDDQVGNALDSSISLNVKDCTTWDAFKLIARHFNDRFLDSGELMPLCIEPVGPEVSVKPLDSFTEGVIDDIVLKDVTAREAICEIIRKSPIKLKYRSFQPRTGECRVYIHMYLDDFTEINNENRPKLSYGESNWWADQVVETTGYAEALKRLNEIRRPN